MRDRDYKSLGTRKHIRRCLAVCAVLSLLSSFILEMPKVRRSRKPPPDGWELIEPTLDELDQKMREGKPLILALRHSHISYSLNMFDKRCD